MAQVMPVSKWSPLQLWLRLQQFSSVTWSTKTGTLEKMSVPKEVQKYKKKQIYQKKLAEIVLMRFLKISCEVQTFQNKV